MEEVSTEKQSPQMNGNGNLPLPDDVDGMAEAAEAAAVALSNSDAAVAAGVTQSPPVARVITQGSAATQQDDPAPGHQEQDPAEAPACRICGISDPDKPMLRFLPTKLDPATAHAAPSVVTFTQEIPLHIFCGKTAAILPTVNAPELEILTKAGLKNKHGIGSEVAGALARTRCATYTEGGREKQFYLVREFEANLAAVRQTVVTFQPEMTVSRELFPRPQPELHPAVPISSGAALPPGAALTPGPIFLPGPAFPPGIAFPSGVAFSPQDTVAHSPALLHLAGAYDAGLEHHNFIPMLQPQQHVQPPPVPQLKASPHKAAVARIAKPRKPSAPSPAVQDAKIRCPCGGTYFPPTSSKGVQSWRQHVVTKKHQKWMEDHGVLGAV